VDSPEFIAPTPERARRGVELIDKAIADDDGRPAQPYYGPDILMTMLRRRTITAEMFEAGEDFRRAFRKAYVSDITASDPSQPYVSGLGFGRTFIEGPTQARESLWKALDHLGGLAFQSGSIMWHVIGLEWTIKEWALNYSRQRLRHISQETASGVLIGALCSLVRFYGHEKSG
jgi:hypothetical protein